MPTYLSRADRLHVCNILCLDCRLADRAATAQIEREGTVEFSHPESGNVNVEPPLELESHRWRWQACRQRAEFLALKHACSILRQSSNPVCGSWKSQAAQSLTCSIMEKPHSGLDDVWESYSHALEKGCLGERGREKRSRPPKIWDCYVMTQRYWSHSSKSQKSYISAGRPMMDNGHWKQNQTLFALATVMMSKVYVHHWQTPLLMIPHKGLPS